MRSSRKWLVWIFLAILVFLALVAVVSVAAFLLMRQQPGSVAAAWRDPISEIRPDEISPELALFPMAGALELETVDAAITNGDLETAYAVLVFGLNLSDAQRIGRLILLGRAFTDAEKPERAGLAYQQIYDLAILSPHFTDAARAEALLSSGRGWAALGQDVEALRAYDQVYTLALHSPYLQNAYRRDLLVLLEGAYQELGAIDSAELCREGVVELDHQIGSRPQVLPFRSPELNGAGDPVSSTEVGDLEEFRRQAAFALLQATPAGGKAPAGLVNTLADALRAEDAAKLALYRQELANTTQLSRRVDVHWHLIRWLTLKYQVATRGFGLSIVPEWEEQVADIRSVLSTAYEDLLFDYEDWVTGLPDASLIEPGIYKVRRLGMLAGRLGQYSNYREQPLAEGIREAVTNLIAAGFTEQLYIDMMTDEAGLHFFLSPAKP